MSGALKFRRFETHRAFFLTVRQLEHRIARWKLNDPATSLADHLHPCIPAFDSGRRVKLEDLFEKMITLAAEHECKVAQPRPELLGVELDSRAAYAICLFIAAEAATRCMKYRALEDVLGLTTRLVTILDELIGIDHPTKDPYPDFSRLFLLSANRAFIHELARPDLINHDYFARRASEAEPRLREQFSVLPGQFHDSLFMAAIFVAGSEDGMRKALKVKLRHKSASRNESFEPA
jgi:hypothetical protein